MGVRGRNAVVDVSKVRLAQPKGLDPASAAHWQTIVTGVDAGHFTHADAPMLEKYCQALALADLAHAALAADGALDEDGHASAWHNILSQQIKAISMLAARLRLCPQGRFDRTRAGTTGRSDQSAKRPWETDDDDGLIARPKPWEFQSTNAADDDDELIPKPPGWAPK